MASTEIAELRQTIIQLERSLDAVRSRHGDTLAVRRLVNDLERLDIDAAELEQALPQNQAGAAKADVIYVPDSKSDEAAWMGAQDEGLGFHSRERTR